MIDGSKNALFIHHPRKYGLPLLWQMLQVQTGDPDAKAWFGGIEKEDGSSTEFLGMGVGKEVARGSRSGRGSRRGRDNFEGGGGGKAP